MAAIGSFAPAGSSGPGWQVDIPSLTKLIMSAGSYGLKQLALGGIDIHTIGCILMIAEYAPASKEFRKTVNRAREQQRNQRLWMYKVIEIGTATNFLADQLLKTRAGENVLALLAATSSFADEDSCVSILAALFESAKVSADNIPGTSQLRSLRNVLAPLGRMTGFGDKLLRYNQFLRNLIVSSNVDPYRSVPEPTDIANLVRLLHKVCTSEEHYVLKYDGSVGAAWLVTYACEVLGLHACALNARSESHDPVPITGSYEEASVIINLAATETKYTLYLAKEVYEVITAVEPLEKARRGWAIDCSKENFLLYRHPRIDESPSYDALSVFTAIATLNRASQIASTLGIWHAGVNPKDSSCASGLSLYLTHVLPQIHDRCLRILKILGFRPGDLSRFVSRADEDVKVSKFFVGHQSVSNGHGERISTRLELLDRGFDSTIDIFNCLKVFVWTVDGNFEGHHSHEHNPEFRNCRCHEARNHGGLSTSADSAFLDWALGLRNEIGQTVADAVEFASILAFTNWDSSLRIMSVRFFELGDVPTSSVSTTAPPDSSIKTHVLSAVGLCTDSVHSRELLQRDWQEDWLAVDIDGTIMLRNPCFMESLHMIGGQIITFLPGRMLYEGNPCYRLRADQVDPIYQDLFKELLTSSILSPPLQPNNAFPSISARHLFSNHRNDIFVRSEVYVGSQLCFTPSAPRMETALLNTFVTSPCEHGYFGQGLHNAGVVVPSHIGSIVEGLVINGFALRTEHMYNSESVLPSLLYQQTHDNDLGQWLACHYNFKDNDKTSVRVLQLNCCISCTLDRVNAFVKSKPQIAQVAIIAGGCGPQTQAQVGSSQGICKALLDTSQSGLFAPKPKAINQEPKHRSSRRSHFKSILRRNRIDEDSMTKLLDLQTVHLSSWDDIHSPLQPIACAVVTSLKHEHTVDQFPEVEIQASPKPSTVKAKILGVETFDVITIFAPLNENFAWGRNERNKEEGIVPLGCLSILGDGIGFEQVVADTDYEDVNRLSRSLRNHFSSLPALPFKKGDIIWVYEHLDPYLCWGRNSRTGNEGIFHPTYTIPRTPPARQPFVAVPEESKHSGKPRGSHSAGTLVFSFGKERILRRGPRREYFTVDSKSRYALIN